MQRDSEHTGQRMHEGTPKKRFMEEVMKDVQRAGVTEEDAKDETIQRQMMHCSDP